MPAGPKRGPRVCLWMKAALQLSEKTVYLHNISFRYPLLIFFVVVIGITQSRKRSVTSRSDHGPSKSAHLAGQQSMNSSIANQGQSDSLQLLSVPWMDIMNSSFDGEGQELQGEGVSAAPTPGSFGALHTSDAMRFDGSPHAMLSPWSFPSLTDNFDVATSAHPLDNQSARVDTGEAVSPKRCRVARDPPMSRLEGPETVPSPVRFEPTCTVFPRSSIPATAPAPLPKPGPSRDWAPAATEQKEACIQKLSELSSSLMKDLNRIITCKLASSFLFTPSDKETAEYLFKTIDGSMSQDNAIGRMLHGSEKFLEILQYMNQLSFASSHPSPTQSLESAAYGFPDPDYATEGSSEGSVEGRVEARWTILQSYLDRPKPPVLTTPSSTSSEAHSGSSSIRCPRTDVPSTLAILTCYTCLLRIFETVFYCIHHSLEYSPLSALDTKLPPTVSGLQINGFLLNNHRSLQIKILLQVSTYMLDSIEKALGFASADKDGNGGVLADPIFQALLQTMLKQEGLNCSQDNQTGMKNARDLMKQVDLMLN